MVLLNGNYRKNAVLMGSSFICYFFSYNMKCSENGGEVRL